MNANRPLLHKLANADPNEAVRRLAVLCLKNGSPARDTLVFLDHLTDSDEEKQSAATRRRRRRRLRRKARER